MLVKWSAWPTLAYLGVRQWRSKPDPVTAESAPDRASAAGLVLRAFLVNSSNPKAIVFMLAVLPQFLDPAAPLWPQYALIAATMVVVDTIVMTGYTGLAARVLRLLRSPGRCSSPAACSRLSSSPRPPPWRPPCEATRPRASRFPPPREALPGPRADPGARG